MSHILYESYVFIEGGRFTSFHISVRGTLEPAGRAGKQTASVFRDAICLSSTAKSRDLAKAISESPIRTPPPSDGLITCDASMSLKTILRLFISLFIISLYSVLSVYHFANHWITMHPATRRGCCRDRPHCCTAGSCVHGRRRASATRKGGPNRGHEGQ